MRFKRILPGAAAAIIAGVLIAVSIQGCLFSSDKSATGVPGDTYHGYYFVSSPSAVSRLFLDSTYKVDWSVSDSLVSSAVVISLYQGSRMLATLANLPAGSTTYSWNVPLAKSTSGYLFGSGSGYRLRFTCAADTAKWDYSQSFSVYSSYTGSLAVTSPAADAEVKMDSAYAIQWKSTGAIGTSVGIQLYKDTSLSRSITTFSSNTGSYTWSGTKSTQGSGNDFHIRVYSAVDPGISALSPAFRIASTYNGSITVGFPRSGDTLIAGVASKTTWTVTGNLGTYVSIALYRDSTLVSNVSSSALATSDSTNWSVAGGIPTSSRYRIKLASVSDPGIFAYSAYFSVKGTDPDEYEKDDSLKLAKPIAVDGKSQQHTLTQLDTDWMRFATATGKKYLISVHSSLSLYVYVTDSAGVNVTSSSSGSVTPIILAPAYAGRYHVRIVSSGSSSSGYGPYAVSVAEFDSLQSAFPITFSSPDAKTVWSAGSNYKVAWTPDSANYGAYVNLSLYNDTTQVQSIGSSAPNTGEYPISILSGISTSDRYRIRMSTSSSSQIYAYSPFFTISGATPDAYEPDNSKGAAKTIGLDGAAQSRNLTAGDQDWIRIDAEKGKKYLASFGGAASFYLYAYILDSLGTQVATQSGSQFALPFTSAYSGPYYLRVNQSGSLGSYSVRLIAYDSTSSGFPVKFTSPDTATVWAAGNSYPITWVPDTLLFGAYVTIALYRDNLLVQAVAPSVSNNGAYTASIQTGLATGGNYRLRMTSGYNVQIFGHSSFFSVSGMAPDTLEPNDTSSAAKTVAPNSGRVQLSLSYHDVDWLRFDAKAQMLYLIQATSEAAVPTTMRLYSGLGTAFLLSNSKVGGADSVNAIAWVCPATGIHSVSVGPYSSGTGNIGSYGFEIKEVDPADYKYTVTAPAAASVVHGGETLAIQWTDPAGIRGSVDIFLYNGDGIVQTVIANLTAGTGSYAFTVPSGLPVRQDYFVKVISRLNSGINGNSGAFSIDP
ncbi:MAG: hypothetical protein JWO30_2515 [Fibrobacteres bacterium]|nr:hypothetical protein [Fibrobacterota bacterium]